MFCLTLGLLLQKALIHSGSPLASMEQFLSIIWDAVSRFEVLCECPPNVKHNSQFQLPFFFHLIIYSIKWVECYAMVRPQGEEDEARGSASSQNLCSTLCSPENEHPKSISAPTRLWDLTRAGTSGNKTWSLRGVRYLELGFIAGVRYLEPGFIWIHVLLFQLSRSLCQTSR